MNSMVEVNLPIFRSYQKLREQLIPTLTDADLRYRVSHDNPSLGELCREIGEVEQAYIESFRTFKLDFSFRMTDPDKEESVAALAAWYQALDGQLVEAIAALSEDYVQNRRIDRGDGFLLPPLFQLEVYKEALLIFYGKVSVYLRAMGKDLPGQWGAWIG